MILQSLNQSNPREKMGTYMILQMLSNFQEQATVKKLERQAKLSELELLYNPHIIGGSGTTSEMAGIGDSRLPLASSSKSLKLAKSVSYGMSVLNPLTENRMPESIVMSGAMRPAIPVRWLRNVHEMWSKFDMHIYTSELFTQELKEVVTEYCIPKDLYPRLPLSDFTMNKLPSKYIRISVEQLEQGGLRIPFSTFFLAVIRHFRVHVSQLVPMGVNREVTTSLKGWKKKFFLIDRRDVLETMPWRHTDTDLPDDFPNHYNESDAEAEINVPIRPPHRHLLYMCGLTTACRHPEFSYMIKDPDGKVLSLDDFLQLPVRRGTIMSKGDHILDNQLTPLRHAAPNPTDEAAETVLRKACSPTSEMLCRSL
nr:hypothetical protein [Tanacetum cinerariifolium]